MHSLGSQMRGGTARPRTPPGGPGTRHGSTRAMIVAIGHGIMRCGSRRGVRPSVLKRPLYEAGRSGGRVSRERRKWFMFARPLKLLATSPFRDVHTRITSSNCRMFSAREERSPPHHRDPATSPVPDHTGGHLHWTRPAASSMRTDPHYTKWPMSYRAQKGQSAMVSRHATRPAFAGHVPHTPVLLFSRNLDAHH